MTSQREIKLKFTAKEPLKYGANAAAEFDDPEWPRYVRITDINGSERLRKDTFRSLPPEIARPYLLKDGDILLARSGATVGKSFYYREEWGEACYAGYLIRLRVGRGFLPRYVYWCLQSKKYWNFINSSLIQATIQNVSAERFSGFLLPNRNKAQQLEVVDFLDRETYRLDQLINKKQKFLELASRRIDALVDKAVSDKQVPRIRFENVVRRMHRPATLSEHDELVRLGLFNRGRGIFKKPAADEEGMGDSSFYFVKEGDLILSGQFAWEGAVALATAEEEGCVVSHRYPVFRGKDGMNTAYLLGLFRSGFGDFLLNEASRGSAGRNRPLNTWRLGKEEIPIPSRELQEAVDRALAFERKLKKKTEQSIRLLDEARLALITSAVTGEIDVAKWGKQGLADRRLEEIEEALRA